MAASGLNLGLTPKVVPLVHENIPQSVELISNLGSRQVGAATLLTGV